MSELSTSYGLVLSELCSQLKDENPSGDMKAEIQPEPESEHEHDSFT